MNRIFTFASTFLATILLSSCAHLEQMQRDSENRYREKYCNYEGAYALGVNDAASDKEMKSDVARLCVDAVKAETQKGYREGYANERKSRPQQIHIRTTHEDRSRWPQPQCVDHWGSKICGYNCIHNHGQVYCAKNPRHHCVAAFGDVKCGVNCQRRFDKVKCDSEE